MKSKTLIPVLISLIFLISCHNKREIQYPVCHHVYFWLNNPDNVQDRNTFEKGIKELVKIPEIKMYHIGKPAKTEKRDVVDNSYTYSYVAFFENIAAHDIYQKHPIHLQFIKDCKPLFNKVVVYDSN